MMRRRIHVAVYSMPMHKSLMMRRRMPMHKSLMMMRRIHVTVYSMPMHKSLMMMRIERQREGESRCARDTCMQRERR
jgi:hypothetical protein